MCPLDGNNGPTLHLINEGVTSRFNNHLGSLHLLDPTDPPYTRQVLTLER